MILPSFLFPVYIEGYELGILPEKRRVAYLEIILFSPVEWITLCYRHYHIIIVYLPLSSDSSLRTLWFMFFVFPGPSRMLNT